MSWLNGMTYFSTSSGVLMSAALSCLPVDELDDPEDLALVVLHGHGEHALGPVARGLVVVDVEPVLLVRGDLVGVLDIEDRARGGHVSRDRLLGQGHHELRVVPGVGVVLGDLEPQLLLARLRVLFQQVEGPRVRARDLAHLPQDVVQQLVVVPLRREGDADLQKLRVLRLPELQERLLALQLPLEVELAEEVAHRARESGRILEGEDLVEDEPCRAPSPQTASRPAGSRAGRTPGPGPPRGLRRCGRR